MRKCVVAALCIGQAIPSVGFALACHDGFVNGAVNGEVQRVHLCAAVGIGMRKGVVAALRVVASVPEQIAACAGRQGRMRGVVDGEV